MGKMLSEWPTSKELWGDIGELPKLHKPTAGQDPKYELIVEMSTNAPECLKHTQWGRKHNIVVVEDVDHHVVMVCKNCGCRAAKKAVGLKKTCPGRAGSHHTQNVLKKLQDGRHPVTNLPVITRQALAYS